MVLLEQIQTINKNDLLDYIGSVNNERLMKRIDNSLKKTFGFWFYKKEDATNVLTLCPSCLKDYMSTNDYIIRRHDHFAKRKTKCDKCGKARLEIYRQAKTKQK